MIQKPYPKQGTKRGKRGPAQLEIDLTEIARLRALPRLSVQTIADRVGVSSELIDKRLREDPEFKKVWNYGKSLLREELAQKLKDLALSGSIPCLIFMCKNEIGMSDNPQVEEQQEREQPAIIGASDGRVVSIATGEVVESSTAVG